MAQFDHYAEPDDVEYNNIKINVAYASDRYVFLGGKSTENGNTNILVFDKPKFVKSNKTLLNYAKSATSHDTDIHPTGQITLGSKCDYNAVIERIQNELEEGFSLGYAMRISSIGQFPEFHNLQDAHEVAINVEETTRFLKSKHPHNSVTFTPQSAQNTNNFDLSI